MLKIELPEKEYYDEETQTFFTVRSVSLRLEHSLVSVSKWESNWHKPFLSKKDKTKLETIDYVRCMTITQNVDPLVYLGLDQASLNLISKYIDDPMTATTFTERHPKRVNRDIITAEIIYYWMIALQIPLECQKWHLNRLLTLINVCNIKNQPKKKMSRAELVSRNRALNNARKEKYNTTG